jgi:hypothetical protein
MFMARQALLVQNLRKMLNPKLYSLERSQETRLKSTDISEEEAFFQAVKNINGLDIIMSLQSLGCYMFPNRSFLLGINFAQLQQKLARRKTQFEEAVMQRKFKKMFGFYGYKILELCRIMSVGERRSEFSRWEI